MMRSVALDRLALVFCVFGPIALARDLSLEGRPFANKTLNTGFMQGGPLLQTPVGPHAFAKTEITVDSVANNHVGKDSKYAYYHPGRGERCYGVWSKLYTDELGSDLLDMIGNTSVLVELIRQHQCPYGYMLPGQVTWPSIHKGLENIVAPLTFLKFLAVVYAYVPYFVALCVAVSFLRNPGTLQLWVLMWLLIMVVLSELVFKRLCQQPRPGNLLQLRDYDGKFVGSCLESCGMPSSHSGLATGWFTLLFLDALFRMRMRGDVGQRTWARQSTVGREWYILSKVARLFFAVPWASKECLSTHEFLVYVVAWFIIMIPVPFMRVILYDHTTAQVFVGALIGPTIALIWWRVVRSIQIKYRPKEGEMICGFIRHNYILQSIDRRTVQEEQTAVHPMDPAMSSAATQYPSD